MVLTNPEVPVFVLWVGNDRVASLYDPEIIGLFFLCSYRVEPVSSETGLILRNEENWNDSKFTVKDTNGSIVRASYSTDQAAFCQGETQCVLFQFLLPPIARIDRRSVRRRGAKSMLKILLIDGMLLLALGFLSNGHFGMWRFILLAPVGFSLAFICPCGMEVVSGIPLPVWNWKWMLLAGWQRGIIGTLVVLLILAAIIFGVAAVFTWIIK